MPRDSNGIMTLPASTWVQTGDTVLPVQHNPPFRDIENALTNSIDRDGRTVWTGNMQAGGYKVTELGDPSRPGDAMTRRVSGIEFETRSHAEAWAGTPSMPDSIVIRGDASVDDGLGGMFVLGHPGPDTIVVAGESYGRSEDVSLFRASGDVRAQFRHVLAKYRKSIALKLPIRGPNYAAILSGTGMSFLIPQAFYIDWTAGHIYLNCSGDIESGKLFVRVHDFATGSHIVTFATPLAAGQSYSEGIVIRYESGVRKLYMQTAVGQIGRFNLSSFPTNLATLTPEATFDVGLHSQFDYRNGKWLVQQLGPAVGAENRRNNYAIYNSDLSARTGTLLLSNSDVGPWTSSSLADYVPKIQTTQIGDGFYFASCGGFWGEGDTPVPYSYQGVKLFYPDGQLADENLIDPQVMAQILAGEGHPVNKIEYEGVVVDREGRIFSLCMTLSPAHALGDTDGIIIFEEFSASPSHIDFLPAARVYPKVDIARMSSGIWPRSSGGKIHNPWTGAELTSWEQILDMMRAMDVPRVAYYTSATTGIVDINNETIPAGCLVEIINADNTTFKVSVRGFGFGREYTLYGSSGSRGSLRRSLNLGSTIFLSSAQIVAGYTHTVGAENYIDTDTLNVNGEIVLSSINAIRGDRVEIKRRSGSGSLAVKNGAGTVIATLNANQSAVFVMGGANFILWTFNSA